MSARPDAPNGTEFSCCICGHSSSKAGPGELGRARGNTKRFRGTVYRLWKCPSCRSIHSLDPVDFAEIYSDYPLNERRLDVFARGTLANLLARLKRAGLRPSDRILDYGCGNGVLLQFLKERRFDNVAGYDPYVPKFSELPSGLFDCVVANDLIEHVPDPRATLRECAEKVAPGGLLYVGTADSEPVVMDDLEPQLMRLHQPFHRVILTADGLAGLARETGFELLRSYRRSYMDTRFPFANYRFLDELNRALDHELDAALDPASSSRAVMRSPRLWFFGVLGSFFPSADEPAVVLHRTGGSGATRAPESQVGAAAAGTRSSAAGNP